MRGRLSEDSLFARANGLSLVSPGLDKAIDTGFGEFFVFERVIIDRDDVDDEIGGTVARQVQLPNFSGAPTKTHLK